MKKRLISFLGFVSLSLWTFSSRAQDGSYGKTIALDVPAYQGIQPNLSLTYSSSVTNGFVGVGWQLTGFSQIQRSGKPFGVPRYNETDLFYLDGAELLPCPTNSTSPGCRYHPSGGTYYAAKIEMGVRIERITLPDSWKVTSSNGTVVTYLPVLQTSSGTYRWGVSQVRDIHGNTSQFAWETELGEAYPRSVSYGPYTITLYRDIRPDEVSFATGKSLGRIQKRLTAIEVRSTQGLIRAYALTYVPDDLSAPRATNRSLLQSVQQFGKNAAVSSNGAVTGPSAVDLALPPTQFAYTGQTLPTLDVTPVASGFGNPRAAQEYPIAGQTYDWDYNCCPGDQVGFWNGYYYVKLQDRWGTATWQNNGVCSTSAVLYPVSSPPYPGDCLDSHSTRANFIVEPRNPLVADFNGDGCSDLLFGVTTVALSDCQGRFSVTSAYPLPGAAHNVRLGDFNGDGIPDVLEIPDRRDYNSAGFLPPSPLALYEPTPVPQIYSPLVIHLSNGNGTFQTSVNGPSRFSGTDYESLRIQVADFNGDGKDDILTVEGCYAGQETTTCGANAMKIYLSNGDGTFSAPIPGPTRIIGQTTVYPPDSSTGWCGLSAALCYDQTLHARWTIADLSRIKVTDLNGDGAADIVALEGWWDGNVWYDIPSTSYVPMSIYLNNGNGTFAAPIPGPLFRFVYTQYMFPQSTIFQGQPMAAPDMRAMFADLNGDGITDFLQAGIPGVGEVLAFSLGHGDGTFESPIQGPAFQFPLVVLPKNKRFGSFPFGDFNGDGRLDLDNLLAQGSTASPGGLNFSTTIALPGWPNVSGTTLGVEHLAVGDFNGDGRSDRLELGRFLLDGTTTYQELLLTYLSSDDKTDLLKQTYGGYGGLESVTYMPATQASGNGIGVPTFPVVTSVTTDGGQSPAATVSFAYEGGLFDRTQRKFLGFKKITKTLPKLDGEAQAPKERAWYSQDPHVPGTVEDAYTCDEFGHVIRRTHNTIEIIQEGTSPVGPPYAARVTRTDASRYSPAAAVPCTTEPASLPTPAKTVSTSVQFNDDGAPTLEIAYGDLGTSDDDVTTQHEYLAANTSDYILGLTSAVRMFAGTDTSGAKLKETLYTYNTLGDLTETADWLDPIPPALAASSTIVAESGIWASLVAWSQTVWKSLCVFFSASVTASDPYVRAHIEYNENGTVQSTQNADGLRSTLVYESAPYDFLVRETQNNVYSVPVSKVTSRDPICGSPIDVEDLNGQVTRTVYDALCRVSSVSGPLGSFGASSTCNLSSGTNLCRYIGYQHNETRGPSADGAGDQWTLEYFDGFGRVFRKAAKGPDAARPLVQDFQFDVRGNPVNSTLPYYLGETPLPGDSPRYDGFNRVVKLTHQDGKSVTTEFGVDTVTVTDEGDATTPAGHKRRETMDVFGRVVTTEHYVSGAWRVTARNVYDRLGRLLSVTNANSVTESYTYDSLGRRLTTVSPHIGAQSYIYDNSGRILQKTDALSQVTRFQYDLLGRLLFKTLRFGLSDQEVYRYTYDELKNGFFNRGHRTSMAGPWGQDRFDYDALGRMVVELDTVGQVAYPFQRAYDSAGRIRWTRYPDGDFVGTPEYPIQYDGAGRPRTIPGIVNDVQYDSLGRALVRTNANGTVTRHTFDSNRQWLNTISTMKDLTPIQSLMYDHDAEGKIGSIMDGINAADAWWGYGYDELHQLTFAYDFRNPSSRQTLAYDLAGNITCNSSLGTCTATSPNYTYQSANKPHAVRAAGTDDMLLQYGYDANGNMTSRTGIPIVFNGEDRPISYGSSEFYQYDGDNQRVRRINSSGTTIFFRDEAQASGCVMTKQIGLGGAVAERVGLLPRWLHTDHLGSVRAITDLNGNLISTQSYTAYGAPQSSTADPDHGFTDAKSDESGLIYLHARYYDPNLGRFISPDPIIEPMHPSGMNAYAYAFNNPVSFTDKTGMDPAADMPEPDDYYSKYELNEHGTYDLVRYNVYYNSAMGGDNSRYYQAWANAEGRGMAVLRYSAGIGQKNPLQNLFRRVSRAAQQLGSQVQQASLAAGESIASAGGKLTVEAVKSAMKTKENGVGFAVGAAWLRIEVTYLGVAVEKTETKTGATLLDLNPFSGVKVAASEGVAVQATSFIWYFSDGPKVTTDTEVGAHGYMGLGGGASFSVPTPDYLLNGGASGLPGWEAGIGVGAGLNAQGLDVTFLRFTQTLDTPVYVPGWRDGYQFLSQPTDTTQSARARDWLGGPGVGF